MEREFLFIQKQKWDSSLDCKFQVSFLAANKWHILNNLGRSLTVLTVVLNFLCSPAVCYISFSLQTLLALWQHKFLFFLPFPLQDVSCFCEGLAHLHCPTITDVTHVFPLLGNKIPQCDNLCVSEDLTATAKAVLFLFRVGNLISYLSFATIFLSLKDMEFVKGMPDKWKLLITINKPTVYANSKMIAYLLV